MLPGRGHQSSWRILISKPSQRSPGAPDACRCNRLGETCRGRGGGGTPFERSNRKPTSAEETLPPSPGQPQRNPNAPHFVKLSLQPWKRALDAGEGFLPRVTSDVGNRGGCRSSVRHPPGKGGRQAEPGQRTRYLY